MFWTLFLNPVRMKWLWIEDFSGSGVYHLGLGWIALPQYIIWGFSWIQGSYLKSRWQSWPAGILLNFVLCTSCTLPGPKSFFWSLALLSFPTWTIATHFTWGYSWKGLGSFSCTESITWDPRKGACNTSACTWCLFASRCNPNCLW